MGASCPKNEGLTGWLFVDRAANDRPKRICFRAVEPGLSLKMRELWVRVPPDFVERRNSGQIGKGASIHPVSSLVREVNARNDLRFRADACGLPYHGGGRRFKSYSGSLPKTAGSSVVRAPKNAHGAPCPKSRFRRKSFWGCGRKDRRRKTDCGSHVGAPGAGQGPRDALRCSP